MIHVTRELLNDWLQKLQGVPVDSPAMQVAHSIVALLNDDVPALPAIPFGPPAGYKMTDSAPFRYADMIQGGWTDNLLIEYGHMEPLPTAVDAGGCAQPVYVLRSDELRAAGAKAVDVPAYPTGNATQFRIQIEDGAWVGTLDEWRALLKLSGKRAMPRWEECMFMGPPPAGHASWNQWANGPVLAGAYIRRIEPGDYKVTGIKVEGDTAKPAPEYRILREYDDFNYLVKRVNAAMQVEGWECQGGVSAIFDPPNSRMCYAQAMVRK